MEERTKQVSDVHYVPTNETLCITPNRYVGFYGIMKKNENKNRFSYGVCVFLEKKPNWFHIKMTKLLLGWEWIDGKN